MHHEPVARRWQTQAGTWLPLLVLAVLVLVVFLNAFLFAGLAANPLIASDNWRFVEVLVSKAHGGDIGIGDLFYKRGPLDHSQPLRKLILLFHYEYFDLDFSIESKIAMAAAALNLALFWWIAHKTKERGRTYSITGILLFAGLAAVYLSLNSSMVFSWPLVTLNYTSHLFLLLFVIALWLCFERPSVSRYVLLFLACLLAALVADDTTMIAVVAGVTSTLLYAARQSRLRHGVLGTVVAMAAFVCYSLIYAAIAHSPSPGTGAMAIGERLAGLAEHISDAWDWISIPLTSSVIHRTQLTQIFGSMGDEVGTAIALVLLLAHVWFWWRALRGRMNLSAFTAINLMLLFYGLVFGMVLARATTHGAEYLWQPRYALIYQWNLVALLLMAIGQFGMSSRHKGDERTAASHSEDGWFGGHVVATAAAVVLLLVQLPLSKASWSSLPYTERYEQKMARQMGQLAEKGEAVPTSCAPLLVVCRYPAERRERLMQFLKEEQLNVFSPEFQEKHGLYPSEDRVSVD